MESGGLRAEMLATVRRASGRLYRFDRIRRLSDDLRDRFLGTEERRRRAARVAALAGGASCVGLIIGGWLWLRPVPTPDYSAADISTIMDFTVLTDEFNRLPIDRRVELLIQLRERLSGMSAQESVLLASFAAGIQKQARQQLEENVSRVMIDLWDKYAVEYQMIAPEDRGAYLDRTVVEFARTMERIAGVEPSATDQEILTEARAQAKRDQEALRRGDGPPSFVLGRAFGVMRNNIGGHASPQQRARAQLLIRDMTRRLRDQDVARGPG